MDILLFIFAKFICTRLMFKFDMELVQKSWRIKLFLNSNNPHEKDYNHFIIIRLMVPNMQEFLFLILSFNFYLLFY